MNKYLIENIEYFYAYAMSLDKQNGRDVVHHIAPGIPLELKHPKTYITTSIRNALFNKKSSFNKLYNPLEGLDFDVEPSSKYDVLLLNKVLLEIEMDGYPLHVEVFKDCFFGSSVNDVAKKTNTDRRSIQKICKFVKKEIHDRYNKLD